MNSDDGETGFPTPSIEYEYVWMNENVFHAILGLDGLAFLFCICCAIAIAIYRRHLTFVNTGFSLIYVFIIGCVMMLISVPLFGIDSNLMKNINIPKACMARIWFLSVGYSFSVGTMIVRVLYTGFMEFVREFKSYQITSFAILLFVNSMAVIDTIIVIAWRWLSPPHKDFVTKEVELIGIRDERRTVMETCNSEKESLLIGFLCFYKGGLLLVALIVSIFKREEEQKRSADYNKCQMGLLSVLVAGAIGSPVVLNLPYDPNKAFAVGGAVLILEVFFLMIWVNVSKISNAHKCKKGETLEFGKYSLERSARCVPCVRPVYGCVYDIKGQGLFNEGYADLDSALDMKDTDPESVKEADEDDNLESNGIGCDWKVSEDVLPDDLPSHDEYNMKPYDPDAEEEREEEEEEETDDEAGDKPEGETSDDDSSSSSSDDEKPKEKASSSGELARSAVSVHLNKSTTGSHASFKEDNNEETENRLKSTESGQKGWWKPLFGGKKEPKKSSKPVQNNKDIQDDMDMQPVQNNKDIPTMPVVHNTAKPNEVGKVEESESSESESEADVPPKRCFTPHGGSASEYDDSSDESDSD